MYVSKYIVNGWTVVEYSAETCKLWRIPYPTYAAFYACVEQYNPSFEECSFGTLDELIEWCKNN